MMLRGIKCCHLMLHILMLSSCFKILRNCCHDLQVVLMNLSKVNPCTLNNVPVQDARIVSHNDIFTVSDRSFRVEFPNGSPSRVLQPVSSI